MAELTVQRIVVLVETEDNSIHQVVLNKKEESWLAAAIAGITGGIKVTEAKLEGLSFESKDGE